MRGHYDHAAPECTPREIPTPRAATASLYRPLVGLSSAPRRLPFFTHCRPDKYVSHRILDLPLSHPLPIISVPDTPFTIPIEVPERSGKMESPCTC